MCHIFSKKTDGNMWLFVWAYFFQKSGQLWTRISRKYTNITSCNICIVTLKSIIQTWHEIQECVKSQRLLPLSILGIFITFIKYMSLLESLLRNLNAQMPTQCECFQQKRGRLRHPLLLLKSALCAYNGRPISTFWK